MKDPQAPQAPQENQAIQAAVFSPQETQAHLASLDYQVVREVRVSQDVLDLNATLALQEQKVREVPLVQGVLQDPKVR